MDIIGIRPVEEIVRGPKGLKGDQGNRGEDGAKGDIGLRGEDGDKGTTGDKGERGDKGSTGSKGIDGDKGERGERGDKGDVGAKGNKGDRGLRGLKGTKGTAGKDGKDFDPRTLTVIDKAVLRDEVVGKLVKDATVKDEKDRSVLTLHYSVGESKELIITKPTGSKSPQKVVGGGLSENETGNWFHIDVNQTIFVKRNRQSLISGDRTVEGELIVEGEAVNI